MAWIKPHGFQSPARPRYLHEPIWVGGGPLAHNAVSSASRWDTIFYALREQHSAKPDSFYDDLASRTYGPRVDLFARKPRPGYDIWGNEVPGNYQPDGAQF